MPKTRDRELNGGTVMKVVIIVKGRKKRIKSDSGGEMYKSDEDDF